jgi:hypothetical protein
MPNWMTSKWLEERNAKSSNFGKLVLRNENCVEKRNTVVELNLGHGALGPRQVKKGDSRRFLVRVTSFRRRLLDEDNLCEKFHVDCCRYAGLIPGDAACQTKIETGQVKVKDADDERTEIEISIIAL